MLFALPDGHSAELVRVALAKKIRSLPTELRRSLNWDQGKEMASTPSSPSTPAFRSTSAIHPSWQRGTNENTNGLLRQYLPRSTDLSAVTQAELNAIARSLNGRPRQTLGWLSPSEAFNGVVALTG